MTETTGWNGWAVKHRNGQIVAEIGPDVTEARIWQVALGWPDQEEIAWHKRNGARAFPCVLTEIPR